MNPAIDHPRSELEELFCKSEKDLLMYFSRRHGAGEEAKDLVQETFTQLARAMQKGQQLKCARGYLFGIARRLSQNVWMSRKHEAIVPLDEESTAVSMLKPDERIEAARETIASLAPLQREILELRFSQALSYAEMADALGIPIGTVRSRLHHAVAELRSRLESDDLSHFSSL